MTVHELITKLEDILVEHPHLSSANLQVVMPDLLDVTHVTYLPTWNCVVVSDDSDD